MKRVVASLALLFLLGAGCSASPTPLVTPELRLEGPAGGTITTESEIEIVGTTNMNDVFVNDEHHSVTAGRFAIPVRLLNGENRFTLLSGNGFTTTTVIVVVTRQ
ncbi:MAG: hypothetical protein WC787_00275 [Patescibacteria group bacterium]